MGQHRTDDQGPVGAAGNGGVGGAGGTEGGSGSQQQHGSGVVDRRSGLDRREIERRLAEMNGQPTEAAPSSTGLERRRGPGRRRSDFAKAAEEGEMTDEQFLFVMAIEAFKKANGKMFPTWTDVLEVVRLLGYRKTMASQLHLRNVQDWSERPDAPTGVRSKPGHPEGSRDAA